MRAERRGLELAVADRLADDTRPRLGLERGVELAELRVIQPHHPVGLSDPPGPSRALEARECLERVPDPLGRPTGKRGLLGEHVVRLAARGRVPAALGLGDRPLRALDRALPVPEEELGAGQEEVVVGGQRGVVQPVEAGRPVQQDPEHLAKPSEVDQRRRLAEHEAEAPLVARVRGEPLDVGERLLERAQRLGVRVGPGGLVRHAREALDGALRLIGAGVVVGEPVVRLLEAALVETLERARGGRVQRVALGDRQALVHHLLGQRVLEHVDGLAGARLLVEELEPRELAEVTLDVARAPPHGLEEPQRRPPGRPPRPGGARPSRPPAGGRRAPAAPPRPCPGPRSLPPRPAARSRPGTAPRGRTGCPRPCSGSRAPAHRARRGSAAETRRCAGCRPARAAGARAGSHRTCPSTAGGSRGDSSGGRGRTPLPWPRAARRGTPRTCGRSTGDPRTRRRSAAAGCPGDPSDGARPPCGP